MTIITMSKNIPVTTDQLIDMVLAEAKKVTRSSYRNQLAEYGIVVFTSRTAAHIEFCGHSKMSTAEKNTKFYRLQYATFKMD